MVTHVGIYPELGAIYVYNTLDKSFNYYIISPFRSSVDEMFQEIKSKVNGELGCACLFFSSKLRYTTRKDFVEFGLLHGFKKIQIINSDEDNLFTVMSQANYESKDLENILICFYRYARIWYKQNGILKLYDSFTFTRIDDIAHKCYTKPSVVFYRKNTDILPVQTLFPQSKFISYELRPDNHGALCKARMIAGDPDIISLKVQKVLDKQLILKIGEITLTEIHRGAILPLTETVPFEAPANILTLYYDNWVEDKFLLPKCKKCLIILTIDENGLFTLRCADIISDNENKWDGIILSKTSIIDITICKSFKFPQKLHFKNDQIDALGIDLGTTRCCAAVNRTCGIQTVALDNQGQRLLPSYVSYDEKHVKCGQIVIHRLQNYSKSSVFDSKRFIGKTLDEFKKDQSWPFEMETLKIYKLSSAATNKDNEVEADKYFLIKLQTSTGDTYKTPEDVLADLLKHIKLKTEEFQGKQLSQAVITVPAAFNQNQMQATYDAAIIAGFKKVNLLPEPVAAAFAYFIDRPIPNDSNLLLFDLGGGTLDVCIFKIHNNELHIISRSGDPNIGGRDFDNLIIQYFEKKLINITVTESKKLKLMLKSQDIKENLSLSQEDSLAVADFDPAVDANIAISRNQFEEMSAALLQQIHEIIKDALTKINFDANQINKVLQVGGGCRMPMIKHMLKQLFPNSEHCCEEHPEEVVAVGAAYYSYYLNLPVVPPEKPRDRNPCRTM